MIMRGACVLKDRGCCQKALIYPDKQQFTKCRNIIGFVLIIVVFFSFSHSQYESRPGVSPDQPGVYVGVLGAYKL